MINVTKQQSGVAIAFSLGLIVIGILLALDKAPFVGGALFLFSRDYVVNIIFLLFLFLKALP